MEAPASGTQDVSGKVAVVTGGASGIGRAIAVTLARHGARAVVIADIDRESRMGGMPTDALITEQSQAAAEYVPCDVSRQSDLVAAVDAAERHGGIDIMVNVAGIAEPGPFLELTPEHIDSIVGVNLLGVVHGCQAAIARMTASGGGVIVNTSSVAGAVAGGAPLYSATKAGVIRLTEGLANKYGPAGIRVNCLLPGLTMTAMTTKANLIGSERGDRRLSVIPLRRAAEPEEIANVALFLASDMSSYVTGASVLVDGGHACHLPDS
jgi:NAD(P)-dependent dehydrogenase (short-subunit alcohol dehydrogenase family)